ncbi:transcriptional regulator with XRE-family HTH domain [Nitrobacteraceae bacterium AZCC 2146]|jgi:transcriptional regulator with XRE-family HTH domain
MRPFTVQQVCAARVFLGWSRLDLGEASGLSISTINNFEANAHPTSNEYLSAIRKAFQNAGVEFQRGNTVGVIVSVQTQPWKKFG